MTTVSNKVYTFQHDWTEFIHAMHSGAVLEVDLEMWHYWLDVLPPVRFGEYITCLDGKRRRFSFGTAEGLEPIIGWWKEGEEGSRRYYCVKTKEINYE